jgi:hypothetical protein
MGLNPTNTSTRTRTFPACIIVYDIFHIQNKFINNTYYMINICEGSLLFKFTFQVCICVHFYLKHCLL